MEDPNADRPLPSYAEEVFAAIYPEIASTENGLPENTVRERLQEDGFEPATIDAAVEYLLLHGYLYEVNGQLRMATDTT